MPATGTAKLYVHVKQTSKETNKHKTQTNRIQITLSFIKFKAFEIK